METIDQLKQAINKLEDHEAKSLLFLLLLQNEQGNTEQISKMLKNTKKFLLKKNHTEQTSKPQTVHIIFGESAGGSLKHAFRDTPYEKTESVITLPGYLSVGPIQALHTKEGLDNRFKWLKNHFRDEFDDLETVKRNMEKAMQQIEAIQPHQQVIIWTCENAAEQTALRVVLYLLKEKANEIKTINTFEAYHKLFDIPIREEDFYPRSSGEINGEQFLLFYEQLPIKLLKLEQRATLWMEGETLLQTNELLRVWEDGQIHNVREDKEDSFIIECASSLHKKHKTHKFMKALRLVGEVIGHTKQYNGDEWIEYRLRYLIEQGVFEYRGELHAMRFYEVKLKESFFKTGVSKNIQANLLSKNHSICNTLKWNFLLYTPSRL